MNNLPTVVSIVVDYLYRVKPLVKFTSREIITESLYKLKFGKRYFSRRILNKYIDSLIVMIRYTKGLVTYEEIRNYLSSYDKFGTLIIPNENEI